MTQHEDAAARHVLSLKLLGIDGGWVDMCREALADGTLTSLEADSKVWEALESESSLHLLDFDEEDPPNLASSARAVIKLARALAGEEPVGTSVLNAMERFDRSGLGSPSGYRPPLTVDHPAQTKLGSVLLTIDKASPDHPSAAFTSLLARYLSGEELKSVRTVEVPVLFDQITAGSVGQLRITEIRHGPAGIHPSPRSMMFLTSDHAFVQALRDAWAISPRIRSSQRSFIWELIDKQASRPLRNVAGSSLGAAWYVALDALKHNKFRASLSLKSLDPSCATTGALDDTLLTSVKGYDNKFQAAVKNDLRVVYPAVDYDEANLAATRYAATATPVRDAPAAVKAVRTRPNRKGIVGWAFSAILLSAVLAVVTTQLEAANTRGTAADLLIKANTLRDSDPRLAGLLSMASDKIATSQEALHSMQSVAEGNDMVTKTFRVTDAEIWSIAASSETIAIGTSNGQVIGFDVATTEKLWSLPTTANYLAISPDGKVLAVIDYYDNLTIYTVDGKTLSPSRTEHLDSSTRTIRLFISEIRPGEGPRAVIIAENGVQIFNLAGTARENYPFSGHDPQSVQAVSASAWTTDYKFGSGVLIAFTDGKVQFWRPQQPSTLEQLLQSTDRFPVLSGLNLNSSNITIATPNGLLDWNLSGQSSVRSRYSENGKISSLISLNQSGWDGISNYDIAVLGDTGLTVSGLNSSFTLHRKDINTISSVPSSSLIAAGTNNGQVLLIDPFNGNKGKVGYSQYIDAIYNDEALTTNIYTNGSTVARWKLSELSKSKPSAEAIYNLPENVKSRQISSIATNGELIAAQTWAGEIVIWNLKSGQITKFLQPEDEPLSQNNNSTPGPIAFVNNGQTLFVQGFNTTYFISPVDWTTTATTKTTNHNTTPPGSGPIDITRLDPQFALLELDPSTGMTLTTIPLPGKQAAHLLAGTNRIVAIGGNLAATLYLLSPDGKDIIHEVTFDSRIYSISPSPTGDKLALQTADNRLMLVDTKTLEIVSNLARQPFATVTWSNDGRNIAIGTHVWSAEPRSIQTQLCNIAGSDLTSDEWKTNVGESIVQMPLCPS